MLAPPLSRWHQNYNRAQGAGPARRTRAGKLPDSTGLFDRQVDDEPAESLFAPALPCQSPSTRLARRGSAHSAPWCGIRAPPPRPSLYPFVRSQMTVGRSRSRTFCRAPARALRHRLCAGFAALVRTLRCPGRTRRDCDRLGAGDSAASLLRAGGSAFTPYRRARPAAFLVGGITVGAARLSPTAAASGCQEGA